MKRQKLKRLKRLAETALTAKEAELAVELAALEALRSARSRRKATRHRAALSLGSDDGDIAGFALYDQSAFVQEQQLATDQDRAKRQLRPAQYAAARARARLRIVERLGAKSRKPGQRS